MKIYTIRIIEGSLQDTSVLKNKKVLEELNDNWIRIVQIDANLDQVKVIQKLMIKHYEDSSVPWYLDGYEKNDKNKIICAFGADDGEGGKIFLFDRDDKKMYERAKNYGVSKGIPLRQMGFLEAIF